MRWPPDIDIIDNQKSAASPVTLRLSGPIDVDLPMSVVGGPAIGVNFRF